MVVLESRGQNLFLLKLNEARISEWNICITLHKFCCLHKLQNSDPNFGMYLGSNFKPPHFENIEVTLESQSIYMANSTDIVAH